MTMKVIAASAFAIAATCGVTSAQVVSAQVAPEGRMFVYHGAASGGCPVLDWHVVAGPNNSLVGMISWNNMQSMAHATGVIGWDRHLNMIATEAEGKGETVTITGLLRPDGWLFADIKGLTFNCPGVLVSYAVEFP